MGIETVLEGKTLSDLDKVALPKGSNEIELDDDMISEILDLLAEGVTYGQIKNTVKKIGTELNPSTAQIKEIDEARLAKIAELKANEE